MEDRVDKALRGLNQTLKEIENLLAWYELEKSERKPGCQISVLLESPTETDLKVQVGMFLKDYFDIQEALDASPSEVAKQLRKRLQRTYNKFQQLVLPEGL